MRVSQEAIKLSFQRDRKLMTRRCYWFPLKPPAAADGGEYQMGVNTNNIDPEVLKYVDRKIDYSNVHLALQSKDTAHPEDRATYGT